jgi:CRISPR-associated protein Csy3
MAKKSSAKIPSVLAFSRKLEVSDALMKSGIWANIDNTDQWNPITIHDKRNRATHSQYGAEDVKKCEPNLSWGDDAVLPHDSDTLRVNFSLKILGQLDQPTACDDPDFEKKIIKAIGAYRENCQFNVLSVHYANNIVNGRFLWRNRCGAESIEIHVKYGDQQPWKFNVYENDYDLDKFTTPSEGSDFAELVKVIQRGLSGKKFEYLEVNAYSKMGKGQRVWPSQEMVLNIPKGEKTKILFALDGCAAIHSEKIGNALRTIDTWYEGGENAWPIAVEPYGSVTSRGEAHRISKNDFYTLLDSWLKNPTDVPKEQQHYIIATLIRGGVFGGKDD